MAEIGDRMLTQFKANNNNNNSIWTYRAAERLMMSWSDYHMMEGITFHTIFPFQHNHSVMKYELCLC